MSHRIRSLWIVALCGVGLLALVNACGPAQAEPLDVTYYYLPG